MPYIYTVTNVAGEIFDPKKSKYLNLSRNLDGTTLRVDYKFIMHLRKDDVIAFDHVLKNNETLTTYPKLYPPNPKNFSLSIIKSVNTEEPANYYVKKKASEAISELFDTFTDNCIDKNYVFVQSELMKQGLHVTIENIFALMKRWTYWYVDRRLVFLNLTKEEINNAEYSPLSIINIAAKNPFKLFTLPIDKCMALAKHEHIDYFNHNKVGHAIGSIVNNYLDNKSAMCMEASILEKELKKRLGLNKEQIAASEKFMEDAYELKYKNLEGIKYVFSPSSGLEYNIVRHRIIRCNRSKSPSRKKIVSGKVVKCDIPEPPSFLSEEQAAAFKSAMKEEIVVISGCAGSGKSTTTAEIIKGLIKLGINVCVTSFTGKAVARISEIWNKAIEGSDLEGATLLTGTMNSLISKSEKPIFDVLLIDEASMVSTSLMGKFFTKFSYDFRIILIGDNNQLKPISRGAFFYDLYESCAAKIHLLKINFRIQSEYSETNTLKLNIASLISSKPELRDGDDFIVIEDQTEKESLTAFMNIISRVHSLGVDHSQIKIISFFQDSLLKLNQLVIKEYFDKIVTANKFIIGERIIVMKNDYNLDVINGDTGIVTNVTQDKVYFVRDSDNKALEVYPSIVAHGYATTVHKAQGSEYKTIILFVPKREKDPREFLNINILYTALSRAKKSVYVIGTREYLDRCLNKVRVNVKGVMCKDLRKSLNITALPPRYIIDDEEDDDGDMSYDDLSD